MTRWKPETDDQRYAKFTERDDNGCLIWIGKRDKQGYGRMYVSGQSSYLAHRFAYERFVGPIPERMQIDHICCNKACVESTHLEAVTPLVNTHRSIISRGRSIPITHCIRGHAFNEENTRYNKRGDRACRACDRENQRTYAARRLA